MTVRVGFGDVAGFVDRVEHGQSTVGMAAFAGGHTPRPFSAPLGDGTVRLVNVPCRSGEP